MKKCVIEIAEDGQISLETAGLPTMTIINSLSALVKLLCRDVVGGATADDEQLAQQMHDHMLMGHYEVKDRQSEPTTPDA